MPYCNPASANAPKAPLIHEVHGEAYKVTKAVYMALPFLWKRLSSIYGAVASTVAVRGQVAIATAPNQIQIIPFPANVSAKQVADSTCWVATLDGKRKYKYQNSYLCSQGLVLRLDHQAPDMQKGMPFIWQITLTNKPWGHGPHGFEFFEHPFKNAPAPFHFPEIPGHIPGVPDKFPPFAPDCLHVPPHMPPMHPPFPPMPPHPDACAPWDHMPPSPDGTIPYVPMPPVTISEPDVDYNPGCTMPDPFVPPTPVPGIPPFWANLL